MSHIEDAVCAKMQQRTAVGLATYGKSMERKDFTPRQWLEHMQLELMNGAIYAEKQLQELDGKRPDADQDDFNVSYAVAELLLDERMFVNTHQKDETLVVYVLCNDVFMWGCADAEAITTLDIEPLWRAWRAHPRYGSDAFCCKHRGVQPQPPLKNLMQAAGCWDAELEALPPNPADKMLTAPPQNP